jgi:hypothetical protein
MNYAHVKEFLSYSYHIDLKITSFRGDVTFLKDFQSYHFAVLDTFEVSEISPTVLYPFAREVDAVVHYNLEVEGTSYDFIEITESLRDAWKRISL